MKYIRGKFQKNISFVEPLYRRVYPNKIVPKINENVSKFAKLDGHDISAIKINNTGDKSVVRGKQCRQVRSRHSYRHLKRPHANDGGDRIFWENVDDTNRITYFGNRANSMIGLINANPNDDRRPPLRPELANVSKVPDSWLRVYPAPIVPGESICSIIFRCILCQLGLTFILILWTMAWMIIINHFEGPYEKKVSLDFQNRQHQLVIDLATQLRQGGESSSTVEEDSGAETET